MAPCRGKRCREGESVNRFRNWSQDDPKSGRMREVRVRILTIPKPITRTAMSKYILGMAAALLAAAVVAVPVQASKALPKESGTLIVYGNDQSKLFSQDGINRAKSTLSSAQFEDGLRVTVDTYPEPPADKRAAAKAVAGDNAKWHSFMRDRAKSRAQSDKTRGIYILIC